MLEKCGISKNIFMKESSSDQGPALKIPVAHGEGRYFANQATLEELGHAKTKRVDVICPGFIADCLETLEEIAMDCKGDFLSSGGGEYHYIPAVNERPDWIAALGSLVSSHLGGWPLSASRDTQALARAKALGAPS